MVYAPLCMTHAGLVNFMIMRLYRQEEASIVQECDKLCIPAMSSRESQGLEEDMCTESGANVAAV